MQDDNVIYRKAFKEVYIIINNLPEDLYTKIPIAFIKTIKDNMDNNYEITIEDLEQKEKMQETTDIMSLVYRDYLCDSKMKSKLIEEESKIIHDKYFNMFKEKKNIPKETSNTSIAVVKEEKWYKRMLNRIKNLYLNKR